MVVDSHEELKDILAMEEVASNPLFMTFEQRKEMREREKYYNST